ncbi:uncharacterized protein FPRO_10443 [Fusarium proliferatum ET1]|uniref:Uncharacterized protein n=1 Tax=Fusarium proliferatum (strain ET1) TaxID=1227346 RepID=A0A1L7VMP8_FUSPR|nr:uncharacterized protein FPRO_10443 [Fusarium proliferatum ET1]CZR40855.1 uncharacterized protein FPRO_10443 [Fusarium proliferatum ET1]
MEAGHTIADGSTRLPIEIILLIVETLIPPYDGSRPILPASHPITKTLVSLTRVCKAIHPTASKLIWQNCLYIDRKSKLRRFRRYISQKSPITGRSPCEAYGSAKLYLSPLHYKFDTASTYGAIAPSVRRGKEKPGRMSDGSDSDMETDQSDEWANGSQTGGHRAPRSISPVDDGYSEYSTHNWRDAPMQDLRTIHILKDVLITLAPVLKIIIVDMPLRDLSPTQNGDILEPLRQGFEALVNIEELISVKDELYVDTDTEVIQPHVFIKWPKLRRLCLYNVMAADTFFEDMASCPQLETAVFVRPDLADDVKGEWAAAWAKINRQDTKDDGPVYQGPKISMAFCDWPPYLYDFSSKIPHWQEVDPDNKIIVSTVATHQRYDRRSRRRGPIASCQDWIRDHALRGTIWSEVETKCQPVTPPIMFEGQVEDDDDEWVDDDDGEDWSDDNSDLW